LSKVSKNSANKIKSSPRLINDFLSPRSSHSGIQNKKDDQSSDYKFEKKNHSKKRTPVGSVLSSSGASSSGMSRRSKTAYDPLNPMINS